MSSTRIKLERTTIPARGKREQELRIGTAVAGTLDESPSALPGDADWSFSEISVFSANQAFNDAVLTLQPKLRIGAVDDPLEQEADRIADEVMRKSNWQYSMLTMPQVSGGLIARDQNNDKKQGQESVATPQWAPTRAAVPAIVNEVLSEPGKPLDADARAFFEPRFGQDFSTVRIHSNAKATESAQALGALAYTVGSQVVLGGNEYSAGSSEGRRLLAHELVHTQQQNIDWPAKDAFVRRQTDVPNPPSPGANATTQTPPARNPPQSPHLTIAGIEVSTYEQLLVVARLLASQLATDAAEVPAGERARTNADDLVKQEQAWEPVLKSEGTELLSEAAVNQATVWYQAFADASKDLDAYRNAKAREYIQQTDAEAVQGKAKIDEIPDDEAENQRSAFLAGDHETLEKIAKVVGTSLLVSSALLEVHEKSMETIGWLTKEAAHANEIIETLGKIVEVAHKVAAAYEAFSAALKVLHPEGATQIDAEANKVRAGFGLAGATATLTGMGSAYMVYFGAILSLGDECVKVVAAITRKEVHELNQLSLEEGDLDSIGASAWEAEPGGRETFKFMAVVMHSQGSEQVPTPVPEAVDKLIIDKLEDFEKGTEEEVPTKRSWLFWKHTDPDKVKYWLLNNRKSIWAMLYGSIRPPSVLKENGKVTTL